MNGWMVFSLKLVRVGRWRNYLTIFWVYIMWITIHMLMLEITLPMNNFWSLSMSHTWEVIVQPRGQRSDLYTVPDSLVLSAHIKVTLRKLEVLWGNLAQEILLEKWWEVYISSGLNSFELSFYNQSLNMNICIVVFNHLHFLSGRSNSS